MFPTAVPRRARIAALAVRSRNIVDSGLCRRTTGVPEWLVRAEQHERLAATPAPVRRATLARHDDAVVVDLLVLSYLRHGTPYGCGPTAPAPSPRASSAASTLRRPAGSSSFSGRSTCAPPGALGRLPGGDFVGLPLWAPEWRGYSPFRPG